MKSGIYKITNKVNGKFYVGSSKDIEHRWYCHKNDLRAKRHINPKLQHSWDFYGEDKFSFDVIEEVKSDENLLLEREQYHLNLLKPYERKIGYNICPTAEGGDNITHNPNKEAFIEKMKIINHGEGNGMFGKTHNENTIKEMKEKSVGRYTLEWFIERYGNEKGSKKFQDRNTALKNRKMNYSYDNKCSGVKRGPMPEEIKKRISERKHHLKIIRNDLHKDILSNNFTIPQLELKYGTSKATILRERRKLV
jgi:group I intron endonuclease